MSSVVEDISSITKSTLPIFALLSCHHGTNDTNGSWSRLEQTGLQGL